MRTASLFCALCEIGKRILAGRGRRSRGESAVMNDDQSVNGEGEPAESPAPIEDRQHLTVALGASAGGLEALEEFFDAVPVETGIAYVVVTHLPAGRVSLLPELLRRHS